MVYQAVYDKIWRCILSNVAAVTHNAICNSMQHQIWNICDVTGRICINLLQCKSLTWCSIIKDTLRSLRQLEIAFYFTLKALLVLRISKLFALNFQSC